MAANVRMIVDKATGLLRCVVIPDFDKQLDDPAWAPADSVGVNVAKDAYLAAKKDAPLAANSVWALQLAKPLVALVSPDTATLIDGQIATALAPPPVVVDPVVIGP